MEIRQKRFLQIVASGIIAVIRANSTEEAVQVAKAVQKGGITSIEITMTVPGALEAMREVKKEISQKDLLLGAGTVLDAETARLCILAGAEFIVSPSLDKGVVKMAHRYQKVVIPGAMSIQEVMDVLETGADAVKIFPGDLFGPRIIKTIKGPLPQANLIPTGGVTLENVGEWIKAGALAVGVGGDLTREALHKKNFHLLTEKARMYVEAVLEARAG